MAVRGNDLTALPTEPGELCSLAEALLRDWLPDFSTATATATATASASASASGVASDPAPHRPSALPVALDWAYRTLGDSGRRLFQQDPLVHSSKLAPDRDGIVIFRTEQQGVAAWGFPAEGADHPEDPPVLIRWSEGRHEQWHAFQDRLSTHIFEGVLSEAIFHGESVAAEMEATVEALEALTNAPTLDIPAHPFWTAPDAGTVRWHVIGDAVLRIEAGTWLWSLARTVEDLAALEERVPGSWNRLDT